MRIQFKQFVRQLEWKEANREWSAETPFGDYHIQPASEYSSWKKPYIWGFEESWNEAETVMHCMRYADRDYNRRVEGCLLPNKEISVPTEQETKK